MSLSLQSMLQEETREQSLWALDALASPSTFDILISRRHLAQWYASTLDTLERIDGGHGKFRRHIAYTAVKVFDIHLSSNVAYVRARAREDRNYQKTLAIGCLFTAVDISVSGKTMPPQIFLRVCDVAQEDLHEFTVIIEKIGASLRPFVGLGQQRAAPLIPTHFFGVLREGLLERFPRTFRGNDEFFLHAERLLDRTVHNLWFASFAPSLMAVASLLVALFAFDVEREVTKELLGYYRSSGGNDVICLGSLVAYLKSHGGSQEGGAPQGQADAMRMMLQPLPQPYQPVAQLDASASNLQAQLGAEAHRLQHRPRPALSRSMQALSSTSGMEAFGGVRAASFRGALPNPSNQAAAAPSNGAGQGAAVSFNGLDQHMLAAMTSQQQLQRRLQAQDKKVSTITSDSGSNNGSDSSGKQAVGGTTISSGSITSTSGSAKNDGSKDADTIDVLWKMMNEDSNPNDDTLSSFGVGSEDDIESINSLLFEEGGLEKM